MSVPETGRFKDILGMIIILKDEHFLTQIWVRKLTHSVIMILILSFFEKSQ